MTDLWPDDLFKDIDLLRAPVVILHEQAEPLSRRTGGLVKGEVWSDETGLRHELRLVGRDGYEVGILQVDHGELPYPCTVRADALRDVRTGVDAEDADDPTELMGILGRVLADRTTRSTLLGLIARVKEAHDGIPF